MGMKVDFSNIEKSLMNNSIEVSAQLGIENSVNGIPVFAKSGDSLMISCDVKSIQIIYPTKNQYFRALGIIARNGVKEYQIVENCLTTELGIMLDCSRNAVRTVSFLKEFIRNLALMGYNQLQLYTEDTYEVENEPYFGYMRGRYSKNEMKEIDDYAYSYGIEIVPCVQTLAHLNAIFRWSEYASILDVADIALIDDDRTYALIDNMFRTLASSFRSRKIHIGMDEAHLVGRGKYEDIHGSVKSRSELILKHLTKVVAIAEKYGYQPMMWSDMFFRLAFNGDYWVHDDLKKVPDSVVKKVPKNIRLVYWDYYHYDYKEYAQMLSAHLAFNREVVFAGGAWIWTGFTPQNTYSFACTKPALDACFDKRIDKIMFTMWGDNGAECSALGVLPTLCYAAERVYGHDDYKCAFKTLFGVEAEKFLSIDLANLIYKTERPSCANPSKYALYSDPVGGWLDYALENGLSEEYKKHAITLKAVENQAGRYAYIFKTQRVLCEVLALKYDLGVKVREAYAQKDKERLNLLLKERFYPLLGKLDVFYKVFRTQWMHENKPFGFEVQDYRIGGLIKRIEHDIEIITAYCQGEIDEIAQLEEPLLVPTEDRYRHYEMNLFSSIMTVGIY